jgi:hypothetical protein
MVTIADWLASCSEEKRLFLLRAYLPHEAAAGNGGRMGRLVIDSAWIEAQRAFDPSLQNYLQGLELVIQALEAGQGGDRGLLLLMVLTLLHGTVRTITSKLPDEALQIMSHEGRVEQARNLAMQRQTPIERSRALLTVAHVESGLGNRNSAGETLALAQQEAEKIPDQANRCSTLLSLLEIKKSIISDHDLFSKELGKLCDLADEIPYWRKKTHALGKIAYAASTASSASGRVVGDDYGLTGIYNRCSVGIKNAYMGEKKSTEERRTENKKKKDRAAPFAYMLRDDAGMLDPIIRMIDELMLWDKPVCLVEAALADMETEPSKLYHGLQIGTNRPVVVASLLRTATRLGDKVTGERITKLLLAGADINTQNKSDCSSVWDSPLVIEALAEAGYGDVAQKLIAHKLVKTADVSNLRIAVARGAGRCGDLESIELVANPIKAAGRSASLIDKFNRAAEGAKEGVTQSAASWILAKGVSRKDLNRIDVYAEGYHGLMEHDPKQAEAFLASVGTQLGPAGEKLLHKVVVAGSDVLVNQAFALTDKLMRAVERLPWASRAEFADDQVEYWLARSDFDRALKIVAKLENPSLRPQLLTQIATALIEAGQLDRAVALAATIPDRTEQHKLFHEAMHYLAATPGRETNGWLDRITAGLGKLGDDDRLAKSAALSALVAALIAHDSVAKALDLLDPLGHQALLAACEPLANGVARIVSVKQAEEAAEMLLARLEKQESSIPRIRAACALVRAWGPVVHLMAHTRRAYEMAFKDARNNKFQSSRLIGGFLSSAEKHPTEISILAELASAARVLSDREVLLRLWDQAEKIVAENRGREDMALIDISAGLAKLGETWRKERLSSIPPFQALEGNHHPFAYLEIARAVASLSAEIVYRSRKRNMLSAAFDWAEAKIEARMENDPNGQPVDSWGSYKAHWAEDQLADKREAYVKMAINELPEMPKKTIPRDKKKGHGARSSSSSIQDFLAQNGQSMSFLQGSLRGPKSDVNMWLRMIKTLDSLKAYHAIPRAVLAAQHNWETGKKQETGIFGTSESPGITLDEMESIIDLAMTSLLAAGKVTLAHQLVQIFPNPPAGVDARLAAVAENPKEAEQILTKCLEQRWNRTNIAAVAGTATCLPDSSARLSVAIKILQKARDHGRSQILHALGALVPLVETILAPNDICSAVARIIASEGDW